MARSAIAAGGSRLAGISRDNKFRAVSVRLPDGTFFASRKEHRRWCELLLLERGGQIEALRRQVPFAIEVRGFRVCSYVADFVYHERSGAELRRVVEDAKGARTPLYNLKKRLMWAALGIEVKET